MSLGKEIECEALSDILKLFLNEFYKFNNNFEGATQFHSVTTNMQAVVTIYYHCIIFLLPFNGNKYVL